MTNLLLARQEIFEAWRRTDDGATWGEYCDALAKAQVKKVMDWLDAHRYPDPSSLSGGSLIFMSQEDWEALDKETE